MSSLKASPTIFERFGAGIIKFLRAIRFIVTSRDFITAVSLSLVIVAFVLFVLSLNNRAPWQWAHSQELERQRLQYLYQKHLCGSDEEIYHSNWALGKTTLECVQHTAPGVVYHYWPEGGTVNSY